MHMPFEQIRDGMEIVAPVNLTGAGTQTIKLHLIANHAIAIEIFVVYINRGQYTDQVRVPSGRAQPDEVAHPRPLAASDN